jgi:hypothetical protein
VDWDALPPNHIDGAWVPGVEFFREAAVRRPKHLPRLIERVDEGPHDVDRDDGCAVQDGGVDLEQAPRPRQQVRRLQQNEDVALCDGVKKVAQIGQIVRVQENLGLARCERYTGGY